MKGYFMKHNDRIIIYKSIPLQFPLIIAVFPCHVCNLKCNFCLHALPLHQQGFIPKQAFMDFNLYRRVIDDVHASGYKVKLLRFSGWGEPLMHPRIADMISYATQSGVFGKTELTTNGTLLTEKLSDSLISAGLNLLRISINGLTDKDYYDNCGTHIDYEQLVLNIKYYFDAVSSANGGGKGKVYIKIIDYMLNGSEERKSIFYNTFSPISHFIETEHLIPIIEGINYYKLKDDLNFSFTQHGDNRVPINICPLPFYTLHIHPDGSLVPCCNAKIPGVLGNVDTTSLVNVWNGEQLNTFRIKMLIGGARNANTACSNCELFEGQIHKEEIIDGHENEVLIRMGYQFPNEKLG
jgi:radical SAM protein with 4Fe4S-binding SPASM domain